MIFKATFLQYFFLKYIPFSSLGSLYAKNKKVEVEKKVKNTLR